MNWLTVTVLAALGGLWVVAGVTADRRTARRRRLLAFRRGDDLTMWGAALTGELPVVERPPWRTAPTGDARCPTCQGRRCRPHREGRDCRWDGATEPTAYAAGHPLPRDGRHSQPAAVLRWLVAGRGQVSLPAAARYRLARAAGLARMPINTADGVTP